MMKRVLQVTLVVFALLLAVSVVGAAPTAQEDEGEDYIVQPGDGLIALARRFFGDGSAFAQIVAATNAKAATDSSYREISDPNIILVGEKLVIPGALAALIESALGEGMAMPEEETMMDDAAEPMATTPMRPTADLAGTSWILSSIDGQDALTQTTVTLNFEDATTASGSGGCNGYGTTYEADGFHISFGPTIGTLIACEEEIMDQELAFFSVLENAAFYVVTDAGSLRLFDSASTLLAVFDPANTNLAGTSWDAINYNNGNEAVVTLILGTSATANFSNDGRISGNSGCNEYSGAYAVDGGSISIGPLLSTRKLCAEEGVMDQEAAFLAALESAATYTIDGDTLRMRTADDAMAANFSRAQ